MMERRGLTDTNPVVQKCYAEVTGSTGTTTPGNAMMSGDVRDKFLQCLKANQPPTARGENPPPAPQENRGSIPTMIRNMFSPSGGQSLNYFQRFSAAAFAPIAWMFGN
jgi:hypothetical protein